jgi:YgiT-type zinc finger domain-containing protein
MSAVAEKIQCSCGGVINETTETVSWKDIENNIYSILNVPVLRCSDCEDELYPSNVQISLSWFADEMRKGNLSKTVTYRSIL